MPSHKSAEERVRRNERDQKKNRLYSNKMKDAAKAVLSAPDKKTAMAKLKEYSTLADKMVSKGIVHRNQSANHKSRLAKKVNGMT